MNNFTNKTQKKLNQKWNNNKVVEEHIKGHFTRQGVRDYVNFVSKQMKKLGFKGSVQVAVHDKAREKPATKKYKKSSGWTSGQFTKVGKPASVGTNYDPYDEEEEDDYEETEYDEFKVYFMKDPPTAGGASENNDCFFYCLKDSGINLRWKYPATLKKILGLERQDVIDVELVPIIETKIKCKINICGDQIYTSVRKYNQEINIALENGHYTLKKDPLHKVKGIAYAEKIPLLWNRKYNDSKIVNVYDGTERDITSEEFYKMKKSPISCKFVLIPVDNYETENLINVYKTFKNDAHILKERTNGLINLNKTGTISKTVLKLFIDVQKTITPEKIEQDEAVWLSNSSFSPVIFADNYEGPGHKYDVTSFYPNIMGNKDLKMIFAIKRGEFKKISTADIMALQYIPYGIYRCHIKKSTDIRIQKLFTFNEKNYYTHNDITEAKNLNLELNMMEDDGPNQLLYTFDKCIHNHKIFGEIVNLLFKLKSEKVPLAKDLINRIWGILSQKNIYKYILSDDDTTGDDKLKGSTIVKITPIADNKTMVDYYTNSSMYETDWARIKPFLLSRGRQEIRKIMSASVNIDSVVRCHTDGFICTKKLDVQTGVKLGDLKYEGFCQNVIIKNNISITGKFI